MLQCVSTKLILYFQLLCYGHKEDACSSLCLFSAAMAAATEGGKCRRLSVGFSSGISVGFSLVSGTGGGTVANKASMSFNVKKGWS